MKRSLNLAATALSVAVLLAACGGGGGSNDFFFEDKDPERSEQSGSVTLLGATSAGLNGIYANTNVYLNAVEKVNPPGSDPELCRYRFARMNQVGGTNVMEGDIRYQPGTPTVRVMFITINDGTRTVDYSLDEPVGATVDRANNEVDFVGAEFSNSTGTITLTGSIPMRDDRPEGC